MCTVIEVSAHRRAITGALNSASRSSTSVEVSAKIFAAVRASASRSDASSREQSQRPLVARKSGWPVGGRHVDQPAVLARLDQLMPESV